MKLIKIELIPQGADESLPSAGVLYGCTDTMYLHGCCSLFVFYIEFFEKRMKMSFLGTSGKLLMELLWI